MLSSMSHADIKILRDLAKKKLEIANRPIMEERRRLWQAQKNLRGERPMIVIESGPVVNDCIPENTLLCSGEWARQLERGFRSAIYHQEMIGDDTITDAFFNINWKVDQGSYGVEVKQERGVDIKGNTLGYHWEPPLKNLDEDLEKLKRRRFSVDREGTFELKALYEELFGDILTVRIRSGYWWTQGMTQTAIYLVGLENFMLYMYDNPEGVHKLMSFLRDDHIAFGNWLESEGLLTLNNDNDYVGSGTYGFTTELPQPDYELGAAARLKDLWVLSESQETVGISPGMFAEFIIPYQIDVAERFGFTYYGCCEPVHNRWESIKSIKNLRAVSISPWCDEEFMAEAIGRDYVYSRKPSPTLISTEIFDEDAIRDDIRKTLRAAGNCSLEIIMKDVHNLNGSPERLGRWVQIARETVEEFV